jgi:hypothetical protein
LWERFGCRAVEKEFKESRRIFGPSDACLNISSIFERQSRLVDDQGSR